MRLRVYREFYPCLVLLIVLYGCGGDDDGNAINPPVDTGLTVYGQVNPSGDGEPPLILVSIGYDGIPIVDAVVTINSIVVPFTGTVSGGSVDNPYYELDAFTVDPGTSYTLTVETTYGTKTFNAVMPAAPQITAPSEDEYFADSDPILVSWNASDYAQWYSVQIGASNLLEASGLSVIVPPDYTVPIESTLSVTAINGTGEYDGAASIRAWALDCFVAVNASTVSVVIE